MSPIETVRHLYAAFGRGDVPAILACLAEDVEWEYGQPPNPVPWLQPRRGRAGAAGFFDILLSQVEFHRFEPTRQLADGALVVGLVDFEATVRKAGRKVVEVDEIHLFHFDDAGLVRRFAHRADTLQHANAFLGR